LDHKVLDGYDLEKYVDENTIGVIAIMGVTYTGMYEPVKDIAKALDKIENILEFDDFVYGNKTSSDVGIEFKNVSFSYEDENVTNTDEKQVDKKPENTENKMLEKEWYRSN